MQRDLVERAMAGDLEAFTELARGFASASGASPQPPETRSAAPVGLMPERGEVCWTTFQLWP